MKNIKIIPSFKLQTNKDTNGSGGALGEEKPIKSDLEKPKRFKKETNKDELKYFIHL
jgi:hypothetical protein